MDTVPMNGTARPIGTRALSEPSRHEFDSSESWAWWEVDGIDVWPLLLSRATESPRDYTPTTEYSLIYKGRWKL